ncbi:copper amine oxidase N-terminal domain-containing protein [Paenibacillus sp. ACRRX]|uniref:stalk domain-containing protein n=1 Tax=Paenibacillus sp. ACRRX TaxID=2918206 RepID=UPI001EF71319|nr:copper amine oxidase N-terminal domain-containing protein [Paenibacillus sp. ACRRX]
MVSQKNWVWYGLRTLGMLMFCFAGIILSTEATYAQSMDRVISSNMVKEIRFRIGSNLAVVNGITTKIEQPYETNGISMFPAGVLIKAFGIHGYWEIPKEAFVIMAGQRELTVSLDSSYAMINRKQVTLKVRPRIRGNTLMLPLRDVAEGLGAVIRPNKDRSVSLLWNPDEANVDMARSGCPSCGWSVHLPDNWYYREDAEHKGNIQFLTNDGTSYFALYMSSTASTSRTGDDMMSSLKEWVEPHEDIKDKKVGQIHGYTFAELKTIVHVSQEKKTLETSYMRRYEKDGKAYVLLATEGSFEEYEEIWNTFVPTFQTSAVPIGMKPIQMGKE